MENSNSLTRQFIDFLGNDVISSQVSTELQLMCSGEATNSGHQPALPPCTSYFEVSAKPGPDSSLREVTLTEVKKTKLLTSSSTLDRLLAYNQGSRFFGGGDSQGLRLLPAQQNALSFRREEAPEGGNLPLLCLQDSARGGESQKTLPLLCLQDSPPGGGTQNNLPLRCLRDSPRGGETQKNLPKVPKNEPVVLNLGKSIPPPGPPPGFTKKFGPNSGNVILNDLSCPPHLRPPRLDPPISLGSQTQKKVLVPKTEPKDKYEPNSAIDISPPPGFTSKNYLGGASGMNIHPNEKLIDRSHSNGRIHSLPHPKYGPYKCPQCLTVYPTSQHYAAHVAGHHRNETLGEKKKRHIQKFNDRKFKMVQSPDGLTIVQDQASNSIADEVEVVLGYKNQNGVVLNDERDESVKIRTGISKAGTGHLHVRELKTREEILEALVGPFASGLGKTRSPENRKEDVGSSSSHGNKRNPHWKEPFDFFKRTKPN